MFDNINNKGNTKKLVRLVEDIFFVCKPAKCLLWVQIYFRRQNN